MGQYYIGFVTMPPTVMILNNRVANRERDARGYFTAGNDEYLFDLQADPGETVNLASDGGSAPAALSRLRAVASSQ